MDSSSSVARERPQPMHNQGAVRQRERRHPPHWRRVVRHTGTQVAPTTCALTRGTVGRVLPRDKVERQTSLQVSRVRAAAAAAPIPAVVSH